jgi:hypothetical protein
MAMCSWRSYVNEGSCAHRRSVGRATVVERKLVMSAAGPVLAVPGSVPRESWGWACQRVPGTLRRRYGSYGNKIRQLGERRKHET